MDLIKHINAIRNLPIQEDALKYIMICKLIDREGSQFEEKTGKWIYEGERGRFPVCRCSVCGNKENADWAILGNNVNYCPNCGARMEHD